jgi:hypothetical protein
MLIHLAKRDSTLALHSIALLTRKSMEICRLAQEIHETASGLRVQPHGWHGSFPDTVEDVETQPGEAD